MATALLTELPEIGQIDGECSGGAGGPCADGARQRPAIGPRRIGGGRKPCAMHFYLAALWPCATFRQPRLAARLKANGKSGKQCVIACARKSLTILNAM
ncbi:MAG: hypothetical protein U5N55_13045 [Cypionkella sp.]|nr:hypothetical protein [Cypionkella sp.]